MSPSDKAALVGVAVYFIMRLIDAFIPHGRHFKFIERWTVPDEPEDSKAIDET